MRFFRTLDTALGRLADRLQGQHIERPTSTLDTRHSSDHAALMRSHYSQGIGPMGLGR